MLAAVEDLGRLAELLDRLVAEGRGVTVVPAVNGWEVGWMGGMSGSELAYGPTVAAAVESALVALDNERER